MIWIDNDELDLPQLTTISIGSSAFSSTTSLNLTGSFMIYNWLDLPNLVTFTAGTDSFYSVSSLTLESELI